MPGTAGARVRRQVRVIGQGRCRAASTAFARTPPPGEGWLPSPWELKSVRWNRDDEIVMGNFPAAVQHLGPATLNVRYLGLISAASEESPGAGRRKNAARWRPPAGQFVSRPNSICRVHD
jgi:hypothetical protein